MFHFVHSISFSIGALTISGSGILEQRLLIFPSLRQCVCVNYQNKTLNTKMVCSRPTKKDVLMYLQGDYFYKFDNITRQK